MASTTAHHSGGDTLELGIVSLFPHLLGGWGRRVVGVVGRGVYGAGLASWKNVRLVNRRISVRFTASVLFSLHMYLVHG